VIALILSYFVTRSRYREHAALQRYGLEFLAGSRPQEALQHCIIAKSFRWCCTSTIPIISHLPTSYIRPRSKCSFRFARDLHSRALVTQFACVSLIALIVEASISSTTFLTTWCKWSLALLTYINAILKSISRDLENRDCVSNFPSPAIVRKNRAVLEIRGKNVT